MIKIPAIQGMSLQDELKYRNIQHLVPKMKREQLEDVLLEYVHLCICLENTLNNFMQKVNKNEL